MSIGRAILKYGETEAESFNEELRQTLLVEGSATMATLSFVARCGIAVWLEPR